MGNKIEFFSTVPGVSIAFPIVEAKRSLPDWVAYAKADYSKHDKKDIHVMRCPGIIDVLGTGYVIKAWHDFTLTCTEHNITVTIPDRRIHELLGKESVQIQNHTAVAKFFPPRPWSQRSILKINTPWQVFAPKGVKFIMVPLPYNEQMLFESCIGILDPSLSTELNIQGYWSSGIGTQTIKAGTPLVQLIPMTSEIYDFEVRDATERDIKWTKISKYLNLFGFTFNRNKVKEAYNHHIKQRCPFRFTKD